MTIPNNPAGRLHAILSEALPNKPNKPTREAWANVFQVDASATGHLLYLSAQLIELLRLSRQKIEQIGNVDHDLYFRPIENLERAFATMNLDATWNEFRTKVDDATMIGLAFCADTLSQYHPEEVVEKTVLKELLDDIDNVLKTVLESNLNPTLKTVLTENLENIRRAIIEYRIRGSEGLLRALEASIGALLRHQNEFKQNKESDSVSRFLKLLMTLDRIIGIALKAKQLFGGVVTQLLGSDVDT